jgi:hypothetical protein
MRKTFSTILLTSMFALVMPLMPTGSVAASPPAVAASSSAVIAPCRRGTYRVRRNTPRGRKLTNALIAGGIGAAVGGGLKGGRGALVGAGTASGGYLVYRYVKDKRGRCVPRYVRG